MAVRQFAEEESGYDGLRHGQFVDAIADLVFIVVH
jgi:hypothetical protein